MKVFELALTSIFGDRNLAKKATYVSKSGETKEVRVIIRAPDLQVRFEGSLMHTDSTTLEVMVSDISHLELGDKFIIGGHIFVVQAESKRDSEHLVWQVDIYEINSGH